MARVLAYTSPARGHLYPVVPILDALAGRGHDIAIRTLASQVQLMQARGFAAAAISASVEDLIHDDYKARTPRAASSGAWRSSLRAPSMRWQICGPRSTPSTLT